VIGFRFSGLNPEKIPGIYRVVDWMKPIVRACMMKERKFLPLPGTEIQSSRMQSLYSLNCPNSFYLPIPLKLSIMLGFKSQILPGTDGFKI
jgi:hypothetical protein